MFFAVLFLLPPRTYNPAVDGYADMLEVVEVMHGGSPSYIARRCHPTPEQRARLDPVLDGGLEWDSIRNHELEADQLQELRAFSRNGPST